MGGPKAAGLKQNAACKTCVYNRSDLEGLHKFSGTHAAVAATGDPVTYRIGIQPGQPIKCAVWEFN